MYCKFAKVIVKIIIHLGFTSAGVKNLGNIVKVLIRYDIHDYLVASWIHNMRSQLFLIFISVVKNQIDLSEV